MRRPLDKTTAQELHVTDHVWHDDALGHLVGQPHDLRVRRRELRRIVLRLLPGDDTRAVITRVRAVKETAFDPSEATHTKRAGGSKMHYVSRATLTVNRVDSGENGVAEDDDAHQAHTNSAPASVLSECLAPPAGISLFLEIATRESLRSKMTRLGARRKRRRQRATQKTVQHGHHHHHGRHGHGHHERHGRSKSKSKSTTTSNVAKGGLTSKAAAPVGEDTRFRGTVNAPASKSSSTAQVAQEDLPVLDGINAFKAFLSTQVKAAAESGKTLKTHKARLQALMKTYKKLLKEKAGKDRLDAVLGTAGDSPEGAETINTVLKEADSIAHALRSFVRRARPKCNILTALAAKSPNHPTALSDPSSLGDALGKLLTDGGAASVAFAAKTTAPALEIAGSNSASGSESTAPTSKKLKLTSAPATTVTSTKTAVPTTTTTKPAKCCKICKMAKACGDSCISVKATCSKPKGCACGKGDHRIGATTMFLQTKSAVGSSSTRSSSSVSSPSSSSNSGSHTSGSRNAEMKAGAAKAAGGKQAGAKFMDTLSEAMVAIRSDVIMHDKTAMDKVINKFYQKEGVIISKLDNFLAGMQAYNGAVQKLEKSLGEAYSIYKMVTVPPVAGVTIAPYCSGSLGFDLDKSPLTVEGALRIGIDYASKGATGNVFET